MISSRAKKWILGSVVAWPLLHVLIFLVRFRRLPPDGEQLLWFVPTALLGALLVVALLARSSGRTQRSAVLLGTAAALPFAIAGNLGGGLLGPLGVTVFGTVPLLVGALSGWLAGRVLGRIEDAQPEG